MMISKSKKAKVTVGNKLNVKYELRGKDGRAKPMFQENALARYLIGKKGWVSPKWILHPLAFLLAPFLGYWSNARNVSNLITNAGLAALASRINGSGGEAAFTYIAVGTGTTAANVTDTTLQTETATSGLSRVAASVSRVTTDVTNDSARLTTTFSVSGTVAVTESGVLNAASVGTLLARQVFTAVNVINGDSLSVTWTFDCD